MESNFSHIVTRGSISSKLQYFILWDSPLPLCNVLLTIPRLSDKPFEVLRWKEEFNQLLLCLVVLLLPRLLAWPSRPRAAGTPSLFTGWSFNFAWISRARYGFVTSYSTPDVEGLLEQVTQDKTIYTVSSTLTSILDIWVPHQDGHVQCIRKHKRSTMKEQRANPV